jgi:predicted amidohydrolase
MRVASVAWKIRPVRGDSDYFGHFYDLVEEAHAEAAEVVVLPELHVLEMLPLAPTVRELDAAIYLAQYADAIEGWVKRISDISGLIIVGGSHFRETPEGIKNVTAIGVPGEPLILAEKNIPTVYEQEAWDILPGNGIVALPKGLGVTICYDAQFPEASRALAEAGALIQCVPAWTETQRGFQRVRWACLSRSVENQIFTIHSSLVGSLGREPVPMTYGSSAIICPSVDPFPVDAILRETPLHEEGVVVADLDFDMLLEARKTGEVSNWNDRVKSKWTVIDKTQPTPSSPEPNDGGELD